MAGLLEGQILGNTYFAEMRCSLALASDLLSLTVACCFNDAAPIPDARRKQLQSPPGSTPTRGDDSSTRTVCVCELPTKHVYVCCCTLLQR